MGPPPTPIRILYRRVESGWNLLEPDNRSLFRLKAPFSGNSNNSTAFHPLDRSWLEGTPTTLLGFLSVGSVGWEGGTTINRILSLSTATLERNTNNQPEVSTLYCSARMEHHRPIRISSHQIASFGTNSNESCGLPSAPKHQSEGPTHYSDSVTLYRSVRMERHRLIRISTNPSSRSVQAAASHLPTCRSDRSASEEQQQLISTPICRVALAGTTSKTVIVFVYSGLVCHDRTATSLFRLQLSSRSGLDVRRHSSGFSPNESSRVRMEATATGQSFSAPLQRPTQWQQQQPFSLLVPRFDPFGSNTNHSSAFSSV